MIVESIILAAGKGTRMKSDLPKVMHNFNGKPMIARVIEAVIPFSDHINVVVGHKKELVESFVKSNFENVFTSTQPVQNGTGGAVRDAFRNSKDDSTHFIVLCGDTPLIKQSTIKGMIDVFLSGKADALIVTTILDNPASYGRIERNNDGTVRAITEFLDASPEVREIKEINSGLYFFSRDVLEEFIPKLSCENAKNEYYLTDVIAFAVKSGKRVVAFIEDDSNSISGINSVDELAMAETFVS